MSGDTPTYKACPRCGTANAGPAEFCQQPGCGHHFQTPFTPQATEATPPVQAPQYPYAPQYPQTGQYPQAPVYPQAAPSPLYPTHPDVPRKERIAAGLLAILLGSLGVHLFYLNRTGWGIAFLLVTLFSCGMGAALTVPLGIVQGVLYLVASDSDFHQKYVVEKRFF